MGKKIIGKFSVTIVLFFICLSSADNIYAQEQREQATEGAAGQESEQQISEFSLSGFNSQGKKNWDLSGKSADIFDDVVKLQEVKGNMYGENEEIVLTADKGDFNKKEGKVHLEQDVMITTSSGAKLTTESLDWDRKNQTVNTKDKVYIKKENLVAIASGATGHPNLNRVSLEKDVQVEIESAKAEIQKEGDIKDKTVITCDGPLEIDYEKNIATFKNNVKVNNQDALMYSDAMDVYFAKQKETADNKIQGAGKGPQLADSKIEKIFARGNVKIIKGENISYSDEATYIALEKRIVLTGRPKLVLASTDDFKGVFTGSGAK